MSPSSAALLFEAEMAMAHIPVLTQELVDLLSLTPDSHVVDCTFGAGGHAAAVANRLGDDAWLVACDRDPIAQHYYGELEPYLRCHKCFCPGNFADTLVKLREAGFVATQVYMDLGLSSMQVDTEERGFSYGYDAPLDMRMDPSLPLSAVDILNEWSLQDLVQIFRDYGEERYARAIAERIVRRRAKEPFERTSELVDAVKQSIPTPARFGARNPARRVFQALRIAVNDELDSLRRALPSALSLLAPGGVLAVISFHSLEDRIVKQFMHRGEHPCTCPPSFPVCVCGKTRTLEVVTTRPVVPKAREIKLNPRSSSAKLRVARKVSS